ncbi:unnamed protein product [Nippostrongylus brasiliensis]|uniref:G-protein coupled receptors family 1 profile domain-containing protein n=1 Tax=Nippostrongylus brasiliensis TaxID=27835 RepID=A0A3P7B283_NIPBR|nr:unnamed protein product [Nippostrongylus brasiliensis]
MLQVFKLATFFASVFTLLALALNHYIGIVYPLHRHVITPRSVRCAIALAYLVPSTVFLVMFCTVPGGWLPTTVLFVLICDSCLFQLPLRATMYLRILSHLLNVLKLIADAFIYASRLVEIRYAMWTFNANFCHKLNGKC